MPDQPDMPKVIWLDPDETYCDEPFADYVPYVPLPPGEDPDKCVVVNIELAAEHQEMIDDATERAEKAEAALNEMTVSYNSLYQKGMRLDEQHDQRIAALEAENAELRAVSEREIVLVNQLREEAKSAAALLSPDDACGLGHSVQRALSRESELRAVVEKLPKTAGGVPVVPGMNLWIVDPPDRPNPFEVTVSSVGPGHVIKAWEEDEMHPEWMWCYEPDEPLSGCYSTRQAAEEAAKGKP